MLVSSGGLICVIMQNFIIIGQMFWRYLDFFILKMVAVRYILDFEILKFLVSHQVEMAKIHHHIKFHQNRSNVCREIAFNVFFQNGGRIWFLGPTRLTPKMVSRSVQPFMHGSHRQAATLAISVNYAPRPCDAR